MVGTTAVTGVLEDGERRIAYAVSARDAGGPASAFDPVGLTETAAGSGSGSNERYFTKAMLDDGEVLLCNCEGFVVKSPSGGKSPRSFDFKPFPGSKEVHVIDFRLEDELEPENETTEEGAKNINQRTGI